MTIARLRRVAYSLGCIFADPGAPPRMAVMIRCAAAEETGSYTAEARVWNRDLGTHVLLARSAPAHRVGEIEAYGKLVRVLFSLAHARRRRDEVQIEKATRHAERFDASLVGDDSGEVE